MELAQLIGQIEGIDVPQVGERHHYNAILLTLWYQLPECNHVLSSDFFVVYVTMLLNILPPFTS